MKSLHIGILIFLLSFWNFAYSSDVEASEILAYKLKDGSALVYNSVVYKISDEKIGNILVDQELECSVKESISPLQIALYCAVSALLVLIGGLMSGLTIGFFSIGMNFLIF